MTDAEVSRRAAAKARNRERFPELAALTDSLGSDCRVICIHDLNGNLLLGKAPEPEFALSAEFLAVATTMGFRRKK